MRLLLLLLSLCSLKLGVGYVQKSITVTRASHSNHFAKNSHASTTNTRRAQREGPYLQASSSSSSQASTSTSTAPTTYLQTKQGRFFKLLVFAAITVTAFRTEPLLSVATLKSCFFAASFATACALRRIEDSYTYGYGLSLLLMPFICVPDFCEALIVSNPSGGVIFDLKNVIRRSSFGAKFMIFAGFLQGAVYLLYGIRMVLFTRSRNRSISYRGSVRYKKIMEMDKSTGIFKRVTVWMSTAVLLGLLYSLPLHLHLNAISSSLMYNIQKEVLELRSPSSIISQLATVLSFCGSAIALAALALQTAADAQKLSHKESVSRIENLNLLRKAQPQNPPRPASSPYRPFSTSGLYKIWRHPNYLAEFVFHAGVFAGSIPCFSSWHSVLLAFVGPAIFGSVIRAATTRLEENQKDRYLKAGFEKEYSDWVRKTRRFF